MKILGLQKLTLLDYPGHISAIVFLGGCNFRCPFCQNSSLVQRPAELPIVTEEEFFSFLKKRSGILEGVCVTGGEPTLSPELPDFLSSIKSAGYLVKLDTNGTNPDMLGSLIAEKTVDYVAMDIKAGRANYGHVCGIKNPSTAESLLEKVRTSVELLKNSPLEYEFRTTMVKGLHTQSDFEDISQWISGCKAYYLQSFRDCDEVLQKNHSFSAFSTEEMQHFLSIVQKEIPQACLRGV